jgi:hypothetical protein
MRASLVVALGLLVLRHLFVIPDTGLLHRAVTFGAVTYHYQVYVLAEHTRARLWPVILDLHRDGSQSSDGLRPTANQKSSADDSWI